MNCPKCNGLLETCTYGRRISLERCQDCHGLLAHPSVLRVMKSEWMSEVLDRGDPVTGRRLNTVKEINCPECAVQMHNKHDTDQPHIRYEQCPDCDRIWFDAGEFTDWKYDTLMDRFRSWFATARGDAR